MFISVVATPLMMFRKAPTMAPAAHSLSTVHPSDSSTECTCDPICYCYEGIPEGPELTALLRRGLRSDEETVTSLSLSGEYPKMLTAFSSKVRRTKLVIQHRELMEAIRSEAA